MKPTIACIAMAWLLTGCAGETDEPEVTGATGDGTVVLEVTGESGLTAGLWFTALEWSAEAGRLTGTRGHAVFETEARYPAVAIELESFSGRLVLGYLGQEIRTGYDPEVEPDPDEDWSVTRGGYVLELTANQSRLVRVTAGGAVDLVAREAIPGAMDAGGVERIEWSGALAADGQTERIAVAVNGSEWLGVDVPQPLGQGRPWIQTEGAVTLTRAEMRLVGDATSTASLGQRPIRGIVAGAVSPVDPQRVWITSAYASVGTMRSDDGGASFEPVYPGLHFLSMAPDPDDRDGLLLGDKIGQIHRSTNGGMSWRVVWRVPVVEDKGRSVGVYGVAHDPTNPDRVIAASALGDVLESFDRGRTWEPRSGLPDATAMAMAPDGVAYVGTGQGVYRVTSDSVTAIPDGPDLVTSLGAVGTDVYAGGPTGLFRLVDGGFEQVAQYPAQLVGAIAPSWDGSGVAVGGVAGVHRVDGAEVTLLGTDDRDIVALVPLEDGMLVASPDPGHYLEYFESYDPPVAGPKSGGLGWLAADGTWSTVAVDEPDGGAVAVDASGETVMAAGMCARGVYVSNDGGVSFRHEVALDTRYVQQIGVAAAAPDVAVLATAVGALKTVDRGLTWTVMQDSAYFVALAIDAQGSEIWLGTSTVPPPGVDSAGGSVAGIERDDVFVVRSSDAGQSFDEVLRFNDVASQGGAVSSIATTPDGALVTIRADEPSEAAGLWRLTASGAERLSDNIDLAQVALDPSDNERIVLATGEGVLWSDDGGQEFRLVSPEWSESVTFTRPGEWAAGGEGVVLLGTGDQVTRHPAGLRGRTVEALAFDSTGARLLVAVPGVGVVEKPLP